MELSDFAHLPGLSHSDLREGKAYPVAERVEIDWDIDTKVELEMIYVLGLCTGEKETSLVFSRHARFNDTFLEADYKSDNQIDITKIESYARL